MNESESSSRLSRRGFLGATAGIAAVAALPLSRGSRAAAAGPLTGATVGPASYGVTNAVKAARIADGYYHLPLATTIQKMYMSPGVFGTTPPVHMTQLAATGCQFLVSAEPSKRELSGREQSRLAQWLDMLKNAGLSFRVVLWSESDDSAFQTVSEWLAYWQFYAPVVQAAGILCGYDAGCFNTTRAIEYFPSDPTPDELWMDYYATAFRSSQRLEPLIATAQAAGVSSFGLGEWGWSAGTPIYNPMTIAWWNDYCSYLIHEAQVGNLNLGTIYYGSLGKARLVNVIESPDDPRLPMLRKVCEAVQAG